ncbi:MAG: serine/threonine-protein kinase [Pyrinomonadaceae bacterium]|nr:serine/threonine-protein kinase [Pyrinomonadaceae bacterium]
MTAGTTLGRYEIRSLIGVGGMGEVYLAHDTQLRRPVGLKLLPANFTQDEDRLRRFEQEAYAASALNHPNILTIYEIGQIESTRFMAMEYVEGETLRQHISRSHSPASEILPGAGIKLHEAFDIAIQIASALAASQTAGIAHRDIKPENIMLRRDGYVKVLDFGLAKLTERPETTATEAPTRAMVNTSPGSVMGTVNYMSPEQAGAHTVDSRSDIWSLGVVLYEMITGRVPFEGPTPSHVIVSILEKDQPPLSRYLSEVPEALEWIVSKALTKDRDDRYQTAREMLTDLRRLKQRLDVGAEIERSIAPDSPGSPHITLSNAHGGSTMSGFPLDPRTTQLGTAPTVSSAEYIAKGIGRHKLGLGIALVLLVALAGGAFLWSKLRANKTAHTFAKIRLTQLTNTGKANVATISPDGKYVVHVVNDGTLTSLWVRQVATSSNVRIVEPSEARYVGLTFSPDGNYVYYVIYDKNSPLGVVYQIPVLGGTPRKIVEDVDTPITFSPDGKRIAWIRQFPQSGETALLVANSDGTGQQKIAARQRPGRFLGGTRIGPAWSREGEIIACPVAGPEEGSDRSKVVLVDLRTGAETEASSHRWSGIQQVVWAPHSAGLILTGQEQQGGTNQIWYVSQPGGEVERITSDLNNYNGVSVSSDGATIATVQSQASSSVWFAPNNTAESVVKVTSGTNEGGVGLAIMPDGRILYTVFGPGTADLFVVNADGSNSRQLTSNAALNVAPSVSPDGRYIVFVSTRTGAPHIWRMDSDGTNAKQITNSIAETNPGVSPDGKWVVFQNVSDSGLWKIPMDGGEPVQITNKLIGQSTISPDGKLIACRYREQDLSPFQLGLIDFATGQTIKTIDLPPTDRNLDWATDGRAILYVDARGGVSNVWSQPIDGSPARQLTNFKSDLIFAFDLSRDGKQMVLSRGSISSDVVLIADAK